jgi:nucleotide-binding universal stress UspA family protein
VQSRVGEQRQATTPQHRASEPKSSSRRPVVETAAPAEPTGLDTGHEIRWRVPIAKPSPSRRQAPTVLVPLILNGAAALVAVAAALVAARGRRRRRSGALPSATAQVIHLPPPPVEPRCAVRAA